MASKKTGHREPPKQITIEKLVQIFGIRKTQEFCESASRKTQQDSSDQSPGASSEWFKKHEHRVKTTPPVNEASTSAAKRICSVGIDEQHDSDVKKARTQFITDPELRYRCSFCSERFPSLTNVRDHTRACHREENERRKEERLNTSAKATVHKNVEPEVGPKLTKNPESHIHLFRCIACKFASVSYDHMIEHCQNHVIIFENPEANIQCDVTKKYVICGEKFDIDFDTYNECADVNHSYTFINCDYNLLKHDKWPGIFTNLPKSEIDKINCTSIYYFTRIIRLTSRKKPASVPFMIFQCKKCMKYIDPQSILAHVQENSCEENNVDYPCHICKKPFLNENTMYLHHKRHKAADNLNVKFTKVSFNNYDDDPLNVLLLKAAGYTMNIVPHKTTQKGLSTDFADVRTEVKNNQMNQKAAIDIESAPSRPKIVIVSHAADKKMLFKCDARSMIIQGTKTAGGGAQSKTIPEITSTVTKEVDKIDTVYKCKCELCFHGLEFLLKHLEICHSDSKSTIISCMCGLLFNEQQYQIHYGIHNQGFTKLNVKKIIVVDEEIVALTNKYNSHLDNEIKRIEYNELCRKAIAKLLHTLQNAALAHVKGYKKEDLTKQKIIAAAANRSVGSATDDLTKAILKTQGTMTDIPIHEVNKEIDTPERTVYMGHKSVNTIKRVCLTKTVGSGTDDLNITVMKSQETMTMPERSVYMVHKGVNTIKHICLTKTVGSGTDDLNITVMRSQGTMTLPETQTVQKVNKCVENIIQVSQTKSVVSGAGDLNMSVMRSQGTINTSVIQTAHEVNKDLGNTGEEGKSHSSSSRIYDFNSLILKAQKANEANIEITNTVKSAAENVVTFKKNINVINIKYDKLNKKFYRGSDNMEENQSVVESTSGAEKNEITKDKTKVNCDSESTESKKESGNISMTKHEDCNKTVTKECDKREKVHTNKNEGVNVVELQGDKNNAIEEIMETNESVKDRDMKTAEGNAESKVYTEDELLSEPEMPIYYDAEESILTDDEDPILLYEDDID